MQTDQAPEQLLRAGLEHHHKGELEPARRLYAETLARAPQHPDALHLLGLATHQLGDTLTGIQLVERALAVTPGVAPFEANLAAMYVRLAELLFDARRFDEAEDACRRGLQLQPGLTPGHIRLAACLNAQDRFVEALSELATAAAETPDDPSVHSLAGVALLSLGELDPAIRALRRAVRLDPAFAPGHYNLGVALLLAGNLRAGWREYESRAASVLFEGRRGPLSQPLWTGRPLRGKRILVHAEQGFGDAIQFARYLPFVAARGGQVILECRPELRRLLMSLPGPTSIVTTDEGLPEFDVRVPLLSLPRIIGNIPADVPYLSAPPEVVVEWRERLAAYDGLKVGLAWRGSRANVHDAKRSLRAELLGQLAAPRVHFFLIQKEEPQHAGDLAVTDLAPWLSDFADTAAAVACMDLIVSVDTVLAHVAGALARPVWIMLPFVPDWRWLLDRDDSPWYPTARLFRQPSRGNWPAVLDAVRAVLGSLVA